MPIDPCFSLKVTYHKPSDITFDLDLAYQERMMNRLKKKHGDISPVSVAFHNVVSFTYTFAEEVTCAEE